MDDTTRGHRRVQLSQMIAEKMDNIAKLKTDLEHRKKTIGNSVDEQIVIAEMEYRVVKEEIALLGLQEQHWKSAALWDSKLQTPDIQKDVCGALHSYITSVKENGALPALHASEHLAIENSILVSSQSDKPSIPKVEWAHHSTDLQIGDRLLEVNGHIVIGKDSCEVNQILAGSRPLCRIVFLRPVSVYQLLKNNGCKETSNLRHELTSVVSRLNHKMLENSKLAEQNSKFQNDCEDLKIQNRKLKLQVLSLQSILLYLYQLLEKNSCSSGWENLHSMLISQCPSVFDILRKNSDKNGSALCSTTFNDILTVKKKSIPWLELPHADTCKNAPNSVNPDTVSQDNTDKRKQLPV